MVVREEEGEENSMSVNSVPIGLIEFFIYPGLLIKDVVIGYDFGYFHEMNRSYESERIKPWKRLSHSLHALP